MIRKRICLILAGIVLLFSTVFPSVADEPVESTLPDHYLTACPEQGTVTSHRYKGKEEINVWTPYGYSEHRLYEIVLLMHGDGGTLHSWLTQQYDLFGHITEGRYVFDWMAYEKVTVPFIVVTLNNKPKEQGTMVRDVTDALLFVADAYSVYPQSTVESLIENRDHITIGGLSRGSMLTHWVMRVTPEIAGNYICMSAAGPYAQVPEMLDKKQVRIRKLFSAVGVDDAVFHDITKKAFDLIQPYADESMYLEYAYGHTWQVWLPGVYEALKFILPAYSIDYEIHCSMLYRLKSKTAPHPCLFGRMQNR